MRSNDSFAVNLRLKRAILVVSGLLLKSIGPSGVHALPLGIAAERSVHYFCDYFSFFFLRHILFSQKGLSLVLSHKKNNDLG